jgi:mannitol/fructose-specific phosphotransferase system IIA component (Ntr-type)
MSIAIVASVLDSSLYIPELKLKRRDSALHELAELAHHAGVVRDPALLHGTLLLRERAGSTAVGKGVAVPNARSIAVIESRLVVARSRRGIPWDASDGQPVQLVLLALSPAEHSEELHSELVARAVAAGRLQRNRQKLMEAESFEAVAAVLKEIAS